MQTGDASESRRDRESAHQPRTAWITGASRGIGEALALELASRGWSLVLTARDGERLQRVASRCEASASPAAVAMPGDVTDRDRMIEIAREAHKSGLAIDAAVLNAGILEPFDVSDFDSAIFRRHLEVHVMGAVHCIEAVLGSMLERGRGTLVFVASLAGLAGLPKSAPYCAAKGALVNMAESLRIDLKVSGVHVVLANPGFVESDMTASNEFPMPFLVKVDVAARILAEAIERNRPEVSFPAPLALATKSLAFVPGPIRRFVMSEIGSRVVTSPPGAGSSRKHRDADESGGSSEGNEPQGRA